MIKTFLLLAILIISIFASQSDEVLSRADIMMKSKNKSEIFRAYNDYKNIYLRAIMNSDNDLKKRSLKGIIQSGTILHIDVNRYKKELSSITNSQALVKSNSDVSSKNNSIQITDKQRLVSSSWRGSKLILNFKSNISKSNIKYSKIINNSKKRHRYIFDIDGTLGKIPPIKHKEISNIRIAQYKANILRVVVDSKKPLDINFDTSKKEVAIDLGVESVKAPKAKSVTNKPVASKIFKNTNFSKYIVVIDPGHGGKDSGAVGYKRYKEKDIVLGIGKKLKEKLKKMGFQVYMTRDKDKFIKLKNRTVFANKKNADMFISIHANSIPKSSNVDKAYGLETYFLSPSRSARADRVAATENAAEIEDMTSFAKNNFLHFLNREKIIASNKLSIDLQQSMLSTLRSKYSDIKDGGVREGPFWILVGAQMPAVLVEVGFISNPKEAKRLANSKYQGHIADGLADGVARYFVKNQ